jgi:hypothetical protein
MEKEEIKNYLRKKGYMRRYNKNGRRLETIDIFGRI